MNSIIEAQIELKEQQKLELQRCKESASYFYQHYINKGKEPTDAQKHFLNMYDSIKDNPNLYIVEQRSRRYGRVYLTSVIEGFEKALYESKGFNHIEFKKNGH